MWYPTLPKTRVNAAALLGGGPELISRPKADLIAALARLLIDSFKVPFVTVFCAAFLSRYRRGDPTRQQETDVQSLDPPAWPRAFAGCLPGPAACPFGAGRPSVKEVLFFTSPRLLTYANSLIRRISVGGGGFPQKLSLEVEKNSPEPMLL